MQTSLLNNQSPRGAKREFDSEAGITILEMVAAMMVLTVALLGLAASIGYAVTVSNRGRNLTNTKLVAVSLLEQMETLRKHRTVDLRANRQRRGRRQCGAAWNFAGFPTGYQLLSKNPGPDGIFGTTDDFISPGADNVYGTGDDFTDSSLALSGYSREIVITNLSPNLKRVQVTVRYPDGGGQLRNLVAVSYLNNDTRAVFR